MFQVRHLELSMTPRQLLYATSLLLALIGPVACRRDFRLPAEPRASSAFVPMMFAVQATGREPTTMTGRLARDLPGYGGAFIDKKGVLNVYVSDLPASSSARAIVQAELNRVGKPNREVRFIKAQYSYQYLASLEKPLLPYLGYGVSMWTIDDRRNRFLITVVSEDARARMEKVIKSLKLPRNAFIIERMPYVVPLRKDLRSGGRRPLIS